MFFGFTNCPDACPTAMLNVTNTLREMGPIAAQFQPIFVTIDPERDTPELLRDYLRNFDDRIVGLSGTADQTSAIARAYGVYYQKQPLPGGDYTMNHSTWVYLVSPRGELVRPYVPDADAADFAQALLKETSTLQ